MDYPTRKADQNSFLEYLILLELATVFDGKNGEAFNLLHFTSHIT